MDFDNLPSFNESLKQKRAAMLQELEDKLTPEILNRLKRVTRECLYAANVRKDNFKLEGHKKFNWSNKRAILNIIFRNGSLSGVMVTGGHDHDKMERLFRYGMTRKAIELFRKSVQKDMHYWPFRELYKEVHGGKLG